MATKLPPDPKDDPNYLFKAPIEELMFFGTSEQEKSFNAVEFSRLRNIIQRFGQQLTADEFDTLKHCMQNCINEG